MNDPWNVRKIDFTSRIVAVKCWEFTARLRIKSIESEMNSAFAHWNFIDYNLLPDDLDRQMDFDVKWWLNNTYIYYYTYYVCSLKNQLNHLIGMILLLCAIGRGLWDKDKVIWVDSAYLTPETCFNIIRFDRFLSFDRQYSYYFHWRVLGKSCLSIKHIIVNELNKWTICTWATVLMTSSHWNMIFHVQETQLDIMFCYKSPHCLFLLNSVQKLIGLLHASKGIDRMWKELKRLHSIHLFSGDRDDKTDWKTSELHMFVRNIDLEPSCTIQHRNIS